MVEDMLRIGTPHPFHSQIAKEASAPAVLQLVAGKPARHHISSAKAVTRVTVEPSAAFASSCCSASPWSVCTMEKLTPGRVPVGQR